VIESTTVSASRLIAWALFSDSRMPVTTTSATVPSSSGSVEPLADWLCAKAPKRRP
jgi:hypothetical protein